MSSISSLPRAPLPRGNTGLSFSTAQGELGWQPFDPPSGFWRSSPGAEGYVTLNHLVPASASYYFLRAVEDNFRWEIDQVMPVTDDEAHQRWRRCILRQMPSVHDHQELEALTDSLPNRLRVIFFWHPQFPLGALHMDYLRDRPDEMNATEQFLLLLAIADAHFGACWPVSDDLLARTQPEWRFADVTLSPTGVIMHQLLPHGDPANLPF